MELSDQVVSLELAKSLRELGVKQESLFYWEEIDNTNSISYCPTGFHINFVNEGLIKKGILKYYSAFTVAELGELLPSHRFYTMRYQNKSGWRCKDNFKYAPTTKDITEADARAGMLIYLIENKLIGDL
jgi:hypothetical protein